MRNGRGAVPTEAGRRLLDHARSILQQVERARADVDGLKHGVVGHVTIGLPPTIARLHAAALVREVPAPAFPKPPRASSRAVGRRHQWVTIGRADIGVLYNAQGTATVAIEPLAEGGAVPHRRRRAQCTRFRPPARPAALSAHHPPIARTRSARWSVAAHAIGLRPHVALEVDAITAIIVLAAEGQGYAILPARAVPPGGSRAAYECGRSCNRRSKAHRPRDLRRTPRDADPAGSGGAAARRCWA